MGDVILTGTQYCLKKKMENSFYFIKLDPHLENGGVLLKLLLIWEIIGAKKRNYPKGFKDLSKTNLSNLIMALF